MGGMRKTSWRGAATLAALLMVGFSLPTHAADSTLTALVAGAQRSPANVVRDRYRHPVESLQFFGLRDDETVVEILPGRGYWTEILAPYLKEHGHYIAAIPSAAAPSKEAQAGRAAFFAKLKADPGDYAKVAITDLDGAKPVAPAGTADIVLSFRNLHDWMAQGTAEQIIAGIYAGLKPGGIFGIEDHRALTTTAQDPKAVSGYVREDYAIALIEHAGFKLVARSEVGANPKDTKDYPAGVWTLPPTLKLGDVDKAKYVAIGESDRFTLRFVKP